jgi:hypothetical protein
MSHLTPVGFGALYDVVSQDAIAKKKSQLERRGGNPRLEPVPCGFRIQKFKAINLPSVLPVNSGGGRSSVGYYSDPLNISAGYGFRFTVEKITTW